MVAPSFAERDAAAADSLSSDRSRPTSPELRMNGPPPPGVPSVSSEKRWPRIGAMSVVFMVRSPVNLEPQSGCRDQFHTRPASHDATQNRSRRAVDLAGMTIMLTTGLIFNQISP